jgi:hypothetical protein
MILASPERDGGPHERLHLLEALGARADLIKRM